MTTYLHPMKMTREKATQHAQDLANKQRRAFAVRSDGCDLFVTPFYEHGSEIPGRYPRVDFGYAAIGSLVALAKPED